MESGNHMNSTPRAPIQEAGVNSKQNETFELSLTEHNVGMNDRILFVNPRLINVCAHLCEKGYSKLYFIDSNEKVYDNKHYTKIRYLYEKHFDIHFPRHFFKAIIIDNLYFKPNTETFVSKNGIIIKCGERDGTSISESGINSMGKLGSIALNETDEKIENETKKSLSTSFMNTIEVVHDSLEFSLPSNVDILCYSTRSDGIRMYSETLSKRMASEYGINSKVVDSTDLITASIVLVEYHTSQGQIKRIIEDISCLLKADKKVILENHGSLQKFGNKLNEIIDNGPIITYRSTEIAEFDQVNKYTLLPHLSYKTIPLLNPEKINEIRLGTFGFIGKQKGIEDIISLSNNLKVHSTILLGIDPAHTGIGDRESKLIKGCKRKKYVTIHKNGEPVQYYDNALVEIYIGNHDDAKIVEQMAKCSHIVFAHRTRMEQSGTISYAKRFSRPIFALDSLQSRIGQIYRYPKFTNLTPLWIFRDSLVESVVSYRRERKRLNRLISEVSKGATTAFGAMFSRRIPSIGNINELDFREIRDEDGIEYLLHILAYQT